jgi:hypothetical protein
MSAALAQDYKNQAVSLSSLQERFDSQSHLLWEYSQEVDKLKAKIELE